MKATPEQLEQAAKISRADSIHHDESKTLGYDDVKQIVDQPIQTLMGTETLVNFQLLSKMNLTLLYTNSPRGFITSDSPVVMTDPKLKEGDFYGVALGSPSVEVICPLLPRISALFTHYGPEQYLKLDELHLAELNRRIRFHAYKYFIANTKETNPYWFSGFPDASFIK